MSGAVLMLPNPRRSRKARKAPRKMSALQRKYFGRRRGRKARKARVGRRKKPAREVAIIVQKNPRSKMARKTRRRRRSTKRRFARNPRMARRRFRRNPIDGGVIQQSLIAASIGAGGALLVDLAVGNLVPASLKTSAISLGLVRLGGALLVGMAAGMATGDDAFGEEAAAGAITVTVYQMIKNYLTTNYPNVKLARYVPVGRYLGRARGRRRLGFVRRNRRLGAVRRRRMMLKGLGVRRQGVPRLNGVTRMRVPRTGAGRLGYIGPARTLGRYMKNGR